MTMFSSRLFYIYGRSLRCLQFSGQSCLQFVVSFTRSVWNVFIRQRRYVNFRLGIIREWIRIANEDCVYDASSDPDMFLKSARLQRLASSASDLASHDASPLRETRRDPLAQDCACTRDGLTVLITACLTFATGVTIALIIQIYFGEPQVFKNTPQILSE